jgi:predicted transcriptional regulator
MAAVKKNVTPKMIADELGITSVQFRVFLREQGIGVGRGNRYKFTEKQAEKLVKKYNKLNAA